jgi:asparagine synthase (glutamine-hydrolysing)
MCGISAVLTAKAAPDGASTLVRMHEPIRHRGPDGEGFLLLDRELRAERFESAAAFSARRVPLLGVAFRRLKILDLSEAAAQPMSSPDGGAWIAFNGEIYNFRDLRGELESRGRRFRSSGDTEVALAAYEAWGEACFERFEGMWAMVIADLRGRRLVASRDRFGIKPLHWALSGDRLFLASEAKQILRALDEAPRAHPGLVSLYLQGARIPARDETFFEGIHTVPPASWLEVSLNGDGDGPLAPPTFRTYWRLSDFQCPDPRRPAHAYADARRLLGASMAEAVASHDVADVTVGSLLSGGLDSSLVTSLLAARSRSRDRACPTFSFGLRDSPESSELGYVETLVRRSGLVNHETGLDARWILENAPRVVRSMEEPPLGLAPLAQYRIFQLCREHDTTVVLDGQGADEILAGYPYHQRTLLRDRLRHARLGEFSRELGAIARREGRGLAPVLRDFLWPSLQHRLRRAPPWLGRDYGAGAARRGEPGGWADESLDPSALNRKLFGDVSSGNARIILAYTDKNAMSHSVEARVPYFDRRLVELAFSLPDTYKVGEGQRKRILRDVARELLPGEITERPDRLGFGLPEGRLLRQMWPTIRETVMGGRLLESPCLERRAVLAYLEGFGSEAHDDSRGVWRLYALTLWAQELGARVA